MERSGPPPEPIRDPQERRPQERRAAGEAGEERKPD
jgi:hypothetical protein